METVGWVTARSEKIRQPESRAERNMNMSKLCNICGTEIPDGEEFEIDGQVLCKEHFDQLYTTCDCCGAIVRIDDCTTVADGDHVCSDCLDREYTLCDDCGEYHPNADMYEVNTQHWEFIVGRGYVRVGDPIMVCSDCLENTDRYFQCDDCEDWNTIERRELCDDDRDICCDCADNWRVCTECGTVIHESRTYWDDNDDPYCEYCYNELRRSIIHEYGYKPYPVFGTTDGRDGRTRYDGEDFTFGVELECDKGSHPRDAARDIQALTDRVYCKHDGSLDDGYEVVTMPGTLAWHMNKFPWADIVRISRDYDFTSHDARTCGLHVHIGRNQFGADWKEQNAAIARLILLTNAVWPEICHFSRRNGDMHWAHRNEGFDVIRAGMTPTKALDRVLDRAYNQGRYLAVNVQNDATVELRFNRGTLKLGTIYACIQLANNLAVFAKEHTIDECINAKWDDVVHCREFDELTTYVNQRFASYDADSQYRQTTTYSSDAAAPEPKPESTSVFDVYELLTNHGTECELGDSGVTALPGDLVMLVCDPDDASDRRGPHGPAFATCLDDFDRFLYNDHDHEMHRNARPDLPARQWMTGERAYRVVRSLRNNTRVPSREALLALAERGLTIGDTVVVAGHTGIVANVHPCEDVIASLGHNTGMSYSVLVHFNDSFPGHNGDMFHDTNCWWYPIGQLSAIDPVHNY